MCWKTYFLKYKLASPMHIGDIALGNVQRTLLYIPGHTLWGAVTALLSRRTPVLDYEKIGKKVGACIRFGYLYPELNGVRYLPVWTESGLRYCGFDNNTLKSTFTIEDMQHYFIYSESSTAIIKDQFSAEPAALHETEYFWLQNRTLSNSTGPVRFSGYLYLNIQELKNLSVENVENLFEQISRLFVGANRKLGCGRLELVSNKLITTTETNTNNKEPEPGPLDIPLYRLHDNSQFRIAAAHIVFDKDQQSCIRKGVVQPLIQRQWAKFDKNRYGAGQNISNSIIAWAPGSLFDKEIDVEIHELGRWYIRRM